MELEKLTRQRTARHDMVIRVKGILLLAQGASVTEASRQVGISRQYLRQWAKRYLQDGIFGLKDEARSGRPSQYSHEVVMHVIKIACEMPEKYGRSLCLWDCEEIAKELIREGIVESITAETIRRILLSCKLKPWRHHMWLSEKKSNPRDAEFVARVREIIDIYTRKLSPHEIVICIDEKTSIQARTRVAETKSALPDKVPVRVEHEYKRSGALNLFASFNTRTGNIEGKCYARKRQVEFIDFLNDIEKMTDVNLQIIHVVCDNCSTHHGKEVQKWLEKHPRFQFHFTPVHCSWMDQVEQWFSILQRKRFTYANFKSLDELEKQLKKFIEQWNEQAHGFKWDEKTRMKLEVFINKVKERTQMAQDAIKQANVA
jgi:transposase